MTEHYGQPSEELLADMLEGEIPYPVVQVSVRWVQDMDGKSYEEHLPEWMIEDLPEGRKRNSASWDELKPRSPAELILWAHEDWWPKFRCSKKYGRAHLSDMKVSIELTRWEVWCSNWFSHWTWDVGLSDSNVLESFQRFVERTQKENWVKSQMEDGLRIDKYCLMGAEDRNRWSGTTDGSQETQTTPPCRCQHCKDRGVVTINH